MAAVQSGGVATEHPPAVAENDGAQQVRPVDFSQPTRFTTELRRRIAATLEPLSEALSSSLSAQLKAPVTIAPGEINENTWAAAQAGLEADTVAVGVQADSP